MPRTPTLERITIVDVVKSFDVWRLLTGYDGPTVRRRLRTVVKNAAVRPHRYREHYPFQSRANMKVR